MIPATLRRPENKAILEGGFGKFEQEVGRIHLDDSSEEDLKKSAIVEILRDVLNLTARADRMSCASNGIHLRHFRYKFSTYCIQFCHTYTICSI